MKRNLLKEIFNTGSRVVARDDKGLKKGAMFGLDARVALAIFGTLSVITGAALYGAMKETKVVALMTEFDNVDKAMIEYFFDTGSYIPPDTSPDNGRLKIQELVKSTVSSWKGPYIRIYSLSTSSLVHPSYTYIYAYRNQDVDWSDPNVKSNTCLSGSTSCSIYICMSDIPDDIRKSLDIKIDGTTGTDSGNFRYHNDTNKWACKKGMPYDKSLSPASIP